LSSGCFAAVPVSSEITNSLPQYSHLARLFFTSVDNVAPQLGHFRLYISKRLSPFRFIVSVSKLLYHLFIKKKSEKLLKSVFDIHI